MFDNEVTASEPMPGSVGQAAPSVEMESFGKVDPLQAAYGLIAELRADLDSLRDKVHSGLAAVRHPMGL